MKKKIVAALVVIGIIAHYAATDPAQVLTAFRKYGAAA